MDLCTPELWTVAQCGADSPKIENLPKSPQLGHEQ